MKVLQVNMHHCKTATATLQKYVMKEGLAVVLIESWLVKGRISGLGRGSERECIFPAEDQPTVDITYKDIT